MNKLVKKALQYSAARSGFCGVLFSGMLLVGCSDPHEASDRNVNNALNQYLAGVGGAVCLNLHQWPVDLAPDDLHMLQRFPQSDAAKMQVLQHAGLVSSQDVSMAGLDFFGHPNVGKRYTLTDLGKSFYSANTVDAYGQPYAPDLCVGHKQLTHLVSWQPATDGSGTEITATYQYQVGDVANWAQSPVFKTAFPDVSAEVQSGVKTGQVTLNLLDKGWWVKVDSPKS